MKRTGWIVMVPNWEYNDEFYYASGAELGEDRVYLDKDQAEQARRRAVVEAFLEDSELFVTECSAYTHPDPSQINLLPARHAPPESHYELDDAITIVVNGKYLRFEPGPNFGYDDIVALFRASGFDGHLHYTLKQVDIDS